jgi:hypothetical protein
VDAGVLDGVFGLNVNSDFVIMKCIACATQYIGKDGKKIAFYTIVWFS